MKIAVITGASSGLGTEYVKAVLRDRKDIEKIWVIARRTDRLEKLKEASYANREDKVRELVQETVTTYYPASEERQKTYN